MKRPSQALRCCRIPLGGSTTRDDRGLFSADPQPVAANTPEADTQTFHQAWWARLVELLGLRLCAIPLPLAWAWSETSREPTFLPRTGISPSSGFACDR